MAIVGFRHRNIVLSLQIGKNTIVTGQHDGFREPKIPGFRKGLPKNFRFRVFLYMKCDRAELNAIREIGEALAIYESEHERR